MSQNDTQILMSNPAEHFSSPQALADADELSREAKVTALKQWDMDIRQLEVATEENMQASSRASLADVHAALRALGHEPDGSHSGAVKGGNLE